MSYVMLKDILGDMVCVDMFAHVRDIISKCKQISGDYYIVCCSVHFDSIFRSVIDISILDKDYDHVVSNHSKEIYKDFSYICNKENLSRNDINTFLDYHYLYISDWQCSVSKIKNSCVVNGEMPKIFIVEDVLAYGGTINSFLLNLENKILKYINLGAFCSSIYILAYAHSDRNDIILKRYKNNIFDKARLSDYEIKKLIMRINQFASVSVYGLSFGSVFAICDSVPSPKTILPCVTTNFYGIEQKTFIIYYKQIDFIATISFRKCDIGYICLPILLKCNYNLLFKSISEVLGNNEVCKTESDVNAFILYELIKYVCESNYSIKCVRKSGFYDSTVRLPNIIKKCYNFVGSNIDDDLLTFISNENIEENSNIQFALEDCIFDIGLKFYRDLNYKINTPQILSDFDICKLVEYYSLEDLFKNAINFGVKYGLDDKRLSIYILSAVLSQLISCGLINQFIIGKSNIFSNKSVIYIPSYLSIFTLPMRYKFFLCELNSISKKFSDSEYLVCREIDEIVNSVDYNYDGDDWHVRPNICKDDMKNCIVFMYNLFKCSDISFSDFNFPLIDYSYKYKKEL